MTQQIICAGFGGQGVMMMGQVLAYAGMTEGKHVTWLPSYGPEMRGGTANCSVIISDDPVGAPVVTEPDIAFVMNKPSLDKFAEKVVPGGCLFVNASLIDETCERADIDVYYIPAGELAAKAGSGKTANVAALGAYLSAKGAVTREGIIAGIKKVLGETKAALLPMNKRALELGGATVK